MAEFENSADIPPTHTSPEIYQELLHDKNEVLARIDEMALDIIKNYSDQKPLFVCLMRGGNAFASQLMFSIAEQDKYFHPELDYMTIKTYGDSRSPRPPEIKLGLAPSTRVAERGVMILDDVLDTGHTAEFVQKHLMMKGASSVGLTVLVEKLKDRQFWKSATMCGFKLPDQWLTGWGMDDARLGKEANRWFGGIAIATSLD